MSDGTGASALAGDHDVYELDALQKILARVFTDSWTKAPLINVGAQINVAKADAFRRDYSERRSCRISMTVLIQKCMAMAAMEYPILAGLLSDDGERVVVPKPGDIAITGPIMVGDTAVPFLIERASSKPLEAIAQELKALSEMIRETKPTIEDSLAVFRKYATVPNIGLSNIGMMGKVDHFTAPCISPSVAVMYVPATIQTPIVEVDGSIVSAPCINFCLAFDHRVLAAGPVAQFFDRFREFLENPFDYEARFRGEG